ncbi:MAG: efflux RND transporter periplasmic adaptor subunit [Bacteroidota bacterium]
MKRNSSIFFAIALFLGGIFLYGFLSEKETKEIEPSPEKEELKVEAHRLEFLIQPYYVFSTGRLQSDNRLSLRSEVNGIIKNNSKRFKEGISYKKGELIFSIDDRDIQYEIKALRSSTIGRLSSLLADLKIDHPKSYGIWKDYFESLSVEKNFPEAPEATHSKLLNFLSSRGFYSDYYQLRKLENILGKHRIYAPFNCIVSEGNVQGGTLVNTGSILGSIIDPINFELELYFGNEIAKLVELGSEVIIYNTDSTITHKGKVIRKGRTVDSSTNQIQIFVATQSNELTDGSYWNAAVQIIPYQPISTIHSKLIDENDRIWRVSNDQTLELWKVDRLYEWGNQVIVSSKDSLITVADPLRKNFQEGLKVEISTKR